mmetsp:Transcript_1351/g.2355  ORF Transcript_1351/g.2355 Transcript_1351/m.2355 type:complete len:208 (+) Transcript_1351:162-785(+)
MMLMLMFPSGPGSQCSGRKALATQQFQGLALADHALPKANLNCHDTEPHIQRSLLVSSSIPKCFLPPGPIPPQWHHGEASRSDSLRRCQGTMPALLVAAVHHHRLFHLQPPPHCSWDAPQIFDVAARRPSCFQAQKRQCVHHPKLPEELLSAQVQQQATAMNQGHPTMQVTPRPMTADATLRHAFPKLDIFGLICTRQLSSQTPQSE